MGSWESTVTLKLLVTVSTPKLPVPPSSWTVIVIVAEPLAPGSGENCKVAVESGLLYEIVGLATILVSLDVAVIVRFWPESPKRTRPRL